VAAFAGFSSERDTGVAEGPNSEGWKTDTDKVGDHRTTDPSDAGRRGTGLVTSGDLQLFEGILLGWEEKGERRTMSGGLG
jgi:hypothetical protein